MSAINPAELMRATAVTYIRVQCRSEKHRLYRPTPNPPAILFITNGRLALYFAHPLYRATRRKCLLHFPVWTLHLIAFPRQVCRLWGPLFYAVITSPGSSPYSHRQRTGISRFDNIIVVSRNRPFFLSLPFSFSPPLSFSLFNFQHRAEFRGISPSRKSLVPEIATKILLIHGTNEGSSLILLEKFRNERKGRERKREREGRE